MLERTVDVLVIGAGQAGLALGYHLKASGMRFLLVDHHARLGDSWRMRYDALVLFTPRAYSALPGLSVPGDPDGYPTKDEIAGYLERYARHFDLPVLLDTGIRDLTRAGEDFRARTDAGDIIAARRVVVATGAFQIPAVPPLAQDLSAGVAQFTPESYKRPAQVPAGTVLVAGDGASGRHIALELAADGHAVLLAAGHPRRVSPAHLLGRNLFWWMDRTGLLRASRETPIGRYLMKADPFPGKHLSLRRLRRRGIRVVGRVIHAAGSAVSFATGETCTVQSVLWATGYRDDSRWLAIPEAVDAQGTFRHTRGVSPVPGLYFVGRSWQWTRGSALLVGVGEDARFVLGCLRESMEGMTEQDAREDRRAALAAGVVSPQD